MANARWVSRVAFAVFAAVLAGQPGKAQTPPAASASTPFPAASSSTPAAPLSPPVPALRLYAVEITTGPKWDTSKPPNQQAFMKEHSAHLKKLRDEGVINMGARYGDKGLVVISARDESHARDLMSSDPSMQNETFKFALHEMRVFYPGQVGLAAPPKAP